MAAASIILGAVLAGTGFAQEQADLIHEASPNIRNIGRVLERERARQGLPAVAAIVISGNRIVSAGITGVRKNGEPVLVTFNDRWHLGSCTKAMTATMIGRLVEQGKLSWKTTIAQALPDLKDEMRPEYRSVTIEMLLAHRGGIHHEWDVPGLWDILWKREGTPMEERRKMAKVMLAQPPKVAPGQYFYSNCGYGIAGYMAEVIMGKPYEQLMEELVFKPLGMRTAGMGVPWEGEPPTDPWPHGPDGKPGAPGKFADNPPAIAPAGTIHMSIVDWAKFINEHLNGAQGRDGRLLKAATYRYLQQGQSIDGNPDNQYALGWNVMTKPWAKGSDLGSTGRCLHHGGTNNSWYALAWIAPEQDFAVILTTNMGGEGVFPKADAVMWAVIQDHLNYKNRLRR